MCWSLFCGNLGGLKKLDQFRFRPKKNCTHPVTVTTSDYKTRPRQDYRCVTPPAPVARTWAVQTSELATLWESSKIVTVSDGSLDPWTGRAGFAWILTTPQENIFAKDSKDIWTNPK